MPPLSIMIKPVSSACNMRCRYCFYADVAAHREKSSFGIMTPETAHTLIRRAFSYADKSISFAFQGGEPTLAGIGFFRDFCAYAESCNTRGLEVNYSLQTNAVCLDDEMCGFFRVKKFLLGVSLDGDEACHNALRIDADGNGTYAGVRRGISLLRRHGVDYNVLCVVTKETTLRAKEVWNALSEHVFIQFIPCIDGFDGEKREYSLDSVSYGNFLTETFDCYESAILSGRPVSERRFDNYINILLGVQPELCSMCGVCGRYFLCEADGGVYPCDFYVLDRYRLGSILETSFSRLEKTGTALSFAEDSLRLPEACHDCRWLKICRGGCRRDREPFDSDGCAENRFCESYRMFFEARFDRLYALSRTVARRLKNK